MTKVIYETRGKAQEYCPLAANLYKGCSHGCFYCYVPSIFRASPEEFKKGQARPGVLEALRKEAPLYKNKSVLFCFTCDPYQPIDEELQITRQAIKILHGAGVIVRILTKGGMRSEQDFDLLTARPELSIYGATLTFDNAEDSQKHEPLAAVPRERMAVLKAAHEAGIKTWASLEPVIDPAQSLNLIAQTQSYVDEFKIGKLNHIKNEIDWADFGYKAIGMLKSFKAPYYIKNDLLKYLPGEPQRG